MKMLKRLLGNVLRSSAWRPCRTYSPQASSQNKKILLHVGCGRADPLKLPQEIFPPRDWHEVRLDIDPSVKPDIVASITDLSAIPDESFDAIYSSHNLEHLYAHEVPVALSQFFRVLKAGGFVLVLVPDLQAIAELIVLDKLDDPAYISPAGPIAPVDMLYGFRPALADGNLFMGHRYGFTASTLGQLLSQSGFSAIEVLKGEYFSLQATGRKALRPA